MGNERGSVTRGPLAYHVADFPYVWVLGPDRIRVRLQVEAGMAEQVWVSWWDRHTWPRRKEQARMEWVGDDGAWTYYEATLTSHPGRFAYGFHIQPQRGAEGWFDAAGWGAQPSDRFAFQFSHVHAWGGRRRSTWLPDAPAYLILPERFANGDPSNDPPAPRLRPWGEYRQTSDRHGGDLAGIRQHLADLAHLGVGCIYLTPIFAAPSVHRYDTADYLRIDPRLGDEEQLRELVAAAHAVGIRVVLDAVFNHSGDLFFAFEDVRRQGRASPYWDWFFIESEPVHPARLPLPVKADDPPYAAAVLDHPGFAPGEPNYETFATGVRTMPKLNTAHPEVQEYLLGVIRHWMEVAPIDGWRLDVGDEVNQGFWRRCQQLVHSLNPQAVLVGEVMYTATPWLRGDQWDSVMNYPFREACLDFFARRTIGARTLVERLDRNRMSVPTPVACGLWNPLGSHDTPRFLSLCEQEGARTGAGGVGDQYVRERWQLATCLQFTWMGTPLLYYGDEVGMVSTGMPDCRAPMVWEPEAQDHGMLEWVRGLAGVRARYGSLRHGELRPLSVAMGGNGYSFAFWRGGLGEAAAAQVLVAMNNAPTHEGLRARLPSGVIGVPATGFRWRPVWPPSATNPRTVRQPLRVEEDMVEFDLEPWECQIWVNREDKPEVREG